MIKKISQNSTGVVSYSITSLTDVPNLPISGISNSSTAIFPNGGVVKVYIFSASDDGTTGTWNEMQ